MNKLEYIDKIIVYSRLKEIRNFMFNGFYDELKNKIVCMMIELLNVKDIQISKNLFDKILVKFALMNYYIVKENYDNIRNILIDLHIDMKKESSIDYICYTKVVPFI